MGSPLVQEEYQAEKACDKRHPYRIVVVVVVVVVVAVVVVVVVVVIIIIIIIIMAGSREVPGRKGL